jgi:ferrochelatase
MAGRGIILMNLGSPDSTEVKDVQRYLNEFLMDERVIDYPWLFRKILVEWLIVPKRAPKSAMAYQAIWTPEGSPLVVITEQLREALRQKIGDQIEIAMRYGNPSPEKAFDALLARNPDLEEVLVIPMYPHYAMSSYETAVEYAREIHRKKGYRFRLDFIKAFFEEERYLDALAESIRPSLQEPYDHVLFSYHGIPRRHILKGDITGVHCFQAADCCEGSSPAHSQCYRHQIITTTKKVAERLQLPANKHSFSFQSRLGREEWLKPYTVSLLSEFPAKGIKNLVIICPAFVSDCLETLEEIAVEGKHLFLASGGENFTLVPCMNTQPQWVDTLAGYVRDYANGSRELILE